MKTRRSIVRVRPGLDTRARVIAAALVLALASTAAAGPDAPGRAKDPGTATALSVGATLGGVALVGLGGATDGGARGALLVAGAGALIAGPSAGHWYAGGGAGTGPLLRTTGVLALALGGLMAVQDEDCTNASDDAECAQLRDDAARTRRAGVVVALAGLTVWAASTGHDVATAGRAARQWNQAHGLTIAPTVVSTGGARAPGLGLALRF